MVRVVRASWHGAVASEGVHGMPLGSLLRLAVQPCELGRAQGVLQGAAEGSCWGGGWRRRRVKKGGC